MRRAQRGYDRRNDHGLSLIELVVAMALFALVAVMGAQGLTGMLRLRDDLSSRSEASAELARAVALLRADLGNAVPMPFFTPGEGPIRSALANEPDGFSLSVGGQPVLEPARRPEPVLQRVEWRLEPGADRLTRRSWATLTPLNTESLGPEMVVIDGVRALQLRSYWGEAGWVEGLTPPGIAAAVAPSGADDDSGPVAVSSFSSDLPQGVEITLITEAHGEITLLEALQ